MDRLRGIEYFVCAAEHGGISAAAKVLGVSPPAVSKLLAALESRLRVALFVRHARGLTLTADGQTYLERCRRILLEMDNAEALLTAPAQAPRGTLVVGAPPYLAGYCLAPAMNRFRLRFPEIAVHIRRAYRETDLRTRALDVLVALSWIRDEDLIARRVAQTRFLICAAPAYWSRAGIPRMPSDLAHHDCLVYRLPEAMPLTEWVFEKEGQRCEVALKPRVLADEQGWLIADALNGGGVVRTIDLAVRRHIECGELVPVLLDWEGCEAPPVHVVYHKTQRRNERVRAFASFVRELFAALESERLPFMNGSPKVSSQPEWWGAKRTSVAGA